MINRLQMRRLHQGGKDISDTSGSFFLFFFFFSHLRRYAEICLSSRSRIKPFSVSSDFHVHLFFCRIFVGGAISLSQIYLFYRMEHFIEARPWMNRVQASVLCWTRSHTPADTSCTQTPQGGGSTFVWLKLIYEKTHFSFFSCNYCFSQIIMQCKFPPLNKRWSILQL